MSTVGNLYTELGVDVHVLEPSKEYPPNFYFSKRSILCYSFWCYFGTTRCDTERGEEVIQQSELAAREIPILFMPFGESYFEGADLLWVDETNAIYQQTIEATFISISNFNIDGRRGSVSHYQIT